MATLTVRADEIENGDRVPSHGRVTWTNLPITDPGYGDEDVIGFRTADGRDHVVRADAPYVVERG